MNVPQVMYFIDVYQRSLEPLLLKSFNYRGDSFELARIFERDCDCVLRQYERQIRDKTIMVVSGCFTIEDKVK